MSPAEIRRIALEVLSGIAPEADLSSLSDTDELREVLDLDSMDFLNFVSGLHRASGAPIPEADYRSLFTLGGTVAYLQTALS